VFNNLTLQHIVSRNALNFNDLGNSGQFNTLRKLDSKVLINRCFDGANKLTSNRLVLSHLRTCLPQLFGHGRFAIKQFNVQNVRLTLQYILNRALRKVLNPTLPCDTNFTCSILNITGYPSRLFQCDVKAFFNAPYTSHILSC